MAADQGIIDSVAIGNVKTVGEASAFYTAQNFANSVAHQNRVNVLAETALGSMVKTLQSVTPEQAQADSTLQNGALSGLLASLGSAIAALEVFAKNAGNTPPVTINGSLPK